MRAMGGISQTDGKTLGLEAKDSGITPTEEGRGGFSAIEGTGRSRGA